MYFWAAYYLHSLYKAGRILYMYVKKGHADKGLVGFVPHLREYQLVCLASMWLNLSL